MTQLVNWTKQNGKQFLWNVIFLAGCWVAYTVVASNGLPLKPELIHLAQVTFAVLLTGFFLFFVLDTMIHFLRAVRPVEEVVRTVTAKKTGRYFISFLRFACIAFLFDYFNLPDVSGVGLLFMGTLFFLFGFAAYRQYTKEIAG